MNTQLRLPKLDADILRFIEQHPTDLSVLPNELAKYQVGIKYRGWIYRVIQCESMYETIELNKFLLRTGYVRKDTTIAPYCAVFEIIA